MLKICFNKVQVVYKLLEKKNKFMGLVAAMLPKFVWKFQQECVFKCRSRIALGHSWFLIA